MLMLRPRRRDWWLSHLAIAVVAVTKSGVETSLPLKCVRDTWDEGDVLTADAPRVVHEIDT